MLLTIYMRHKTTEALGPGKRYALWTQGCYRRCKGCISPDSRDMQTGDVIDTNDIKKEILETVGIEGITISGGEPFLQAEALCELLSDVKKEKDLGVIIYTGNTFEQLQETHNFYVKQLLALTDLLIDGEYIDELNDGKSLRGSSNQRVILLTKRYQNHIEMYGVEGRNIELYIAASHVKMVGIPSKDTLKKLNIKTM